ncbi:zinc finger protein with KRAB and SCAN domains 1 [Drosophila hydei]|uniref:Zinc finger protein with KRAB and SCAN domains 1 n=1 Tax=Drosophila hydei TaxID=7224 RepID=A0A6J1M9Y8_DROHY|nr:zinc finger protein with KRAB and SCAN domains 1 [Drosophila hydei]
MFPLLNHSVLVVCRCCLVEQPQHCHSICDNDQLFSQLLALSPTLQIVPSDVICQLCLHRLHDALDFRRRCEESERILRARNEQALDDALECLEREVGCLEQAKSRSMSMSMPMSALLEPVDFGSLDLSDLFRGNQEQASANWDAATLNTPIHLPGNLEPVKTTEEVEHEGQKEETNDRSACMPEPVVPPQRKRPPRKVAAAGGSGKGGRSRTPKSLCPCTECEKKFTRNFQLKLHMISVHGLGDGLRYECEVCSKSFASRHSLRYHFTSLHSTERPFACELCDRRFVLRTQLISHARMHTGETKPRIFDCNVCGKTWPTKSDLRTHLRSHDPDMSKRPYKCDQCNKAFFTRGHLNSHHLVHTGEKPYACTYCDKSYQSVGNLNNHTLRQHSNLIETQLNLKYTDFES